MASKKGVVLYYDILEQLEDFSDEQFGKIARAIIKYDKTGEISEFDDFSIKVAFKMFKPILDRNNQEYEDKCEKNRQNILKRWEKKNTNEYNRISGNTKNTDNDKDKDKDKDIDKDINKKENNKKKNFAIDVAKEIENEDLRKVICEFIKMRITIKKPITGYGLELILKQLNKITPNIDEQIAIVQQSITNSWQGVFPLKADKQENKKETDLQRAYKRLVEDE